MTDRVIRIERDHGFNYFLPLHILRRPIASVGQVTILGGGWNKRLSKEDNRAAYNAVQAINAISGVTVIDIGHCNDGTSRIRIVISSRAGDKQEEIIAILQSAFSLEDCKIELT